MLPIPSNSPPTKNICHSELYSKCFPKLMDTSGFETIIEKEKLSALDLAIDTWQSGRTLDRSIKLEILRSLPPTVAEYLIPETAFLDQSTLSSLFREILEYFKARQKGDADLMTIAREVHTEYEDRFLKEIICGKSKDRKRKKIIKYLKTIRIFGSACEDHFGEIYQPLIMILNEEFHDDSMLVVAVLESMCFNNELRMGVFFDVMDDELLRFLLCRARDARFDFWGLWRGVGSFSDEFNPVVLFLVCPHRRLLIRTLLSYGFQYKTIGSVYQSRCFSIARLRHKGLPIIDSVGLTRLLVREPLDRMQLVLDTFLAVADTDHPHVEVDVVDLVLISRTRPQPYLTPRHLFHNLSDVLRRTFHQKLSGICHAYSEMELYDEDYRTYQPRTLKHLCRCAVRKALADNLLLPDGIDDLWLTDHLKSYLKLER